MELQASSDHHVDSIEHSGHIYEIPTDYGTDTSDTDLDLARVKAAVEGRRVAICQVRQSSDAGHLPCLRPGCHALLRDKGAWIRHAKQSFPSHLWMCFFCDEMCDRKERLAKHVSIHRETEKESAIQRCLEHQAVKVPFFGQCGWCKYTSTDWSTFFNNHVFGHLMGSDGQTPKKKEDWDAPYPPLLEEPESRKTRPRSLDTKRPFDNLPRRDDGDDSDSDDDDGHPSPGNTGPSGSQASQPRQTQGRSSQKGQSTGRGSQNTGNHQGRQHSCGASDMPRLDPHLDQKLRTPPSTVMSADSRKGDCSLADPADDLPAKGQQFTARRANQVKAAAKYKHVRTIFKGQATAVDEVQQLTSGQNFARKCVSVTGSTRSIAKLFEREVANMRRLSHAHLVKLTDHFREASMFSLVLHPVAEFTLQHLLEQPRGKLVGPLIRWHSCLTSAVFYLHRKDVNLCHLDIKPANILIKESNIYLADFGSSRLATEVESQRVPMTRKYAAPELIRDGAFSKGSDVFALGCVFLEMATVMCKLSIKKFHRFLSLVQRQTHYLREYESWDVARVLWVSVLQRRFSPASTDFISGRSVQKSVGAASAMLCTNTRKRPRIQTIAKVFIAFSGCCNGQQKKRFANANSGEPRTSEDSRLDSSKPVSKLASSREMIKSHMTLPVWTSRLWYVMWHLHASMIPAVVF